MDLTHPNIAIQARDTHLRKKEGPLKKVFKNDPRILAEILFCAPVIFAALVLQLSILQWILMLIVLFLYFTACVFRTAAMLQVQRDPNMSEFHAKRIRITGNRMVTFTAVISAIVSLRIFIPIITQMM